MTWWYLSFASETDFLGGCFVQAEDAIDAVKRSHALGINPGGECMPIEAGPVTPAPPPDARNRLLSKVEMFERFEGTRVSDLPQDMQDRIDDEVEYVSEEHNKP